MDISDACFANGSDSQIPTETLFSNLRIESHLENVIHLSVSPAALLTVLKSAKNGQQQHMGDITVKLAKRVSQTGGEGRGVLCWEIGADVSC